MKPPARTRRIRRATRDEAVRFANRGRVALAAAYTFAVLFVGQRPASEIPKLGFGFGFIPTDKAAHFFMYGLLAWLVLRSMDPRHRSPRAAILAVGWVMLVGATDELWQSIANRGRTGDPMDWIADLLGAMGALVAWRLLDLSGSRRTQVESF